MLRVLEELAKKHSDGHFTIMRFTTNWRVVFSTPTDRDDISEMPVGKTVEEAIQKAIDKLYSEIPY